MIFSKHVGYGEINGNIKFHLNWIVKLIQLLMQKQSKTFFGEKKEGLSLSHFRDWKPTSKTGDWSRNASTKIQFTS